MRTWSTGEDLAHVEVCLTWSEVKFGAHIGADRRVDNLANGARDRWGISNDDRWDRDVEGACAEQAVAKYFGIYWVGGNKTEDVGPYQVRATHRADGRLTLHPPDRDDKVFILVTGYAPKFRLVGWIMARDGKQAKWWTDPTGKNHPAWFVPQSALRPIWELKNDHD